MASAIRSRRSATPRRPTDAGPYTCGAGRGRGGAGPGVGAPGPGDLGAESHVTRMGDAHARSVGDTGGSRPNRASVTLGYAGTESEVTRRGQGPVDRDTGTLGVEAVRSET